MEAPLMFVALAIIVGILVDHSRLPVSHEWRWIIGGGIAVQQFSWLAGMHG
jgi:hypothetical protein